jgi:cytochrome c oxidase subunit 1
MTAGTDRTPRPFRSAHIEPGIRAWQVWLSAFIWSLGTVCLLLAVRWQQTWPWVPLPIIGRFFGGPGGGGLTPEFFSWINLLCDSMLVYFVSLPLVMGVVGNRVMPELIGCERAALPGWNRSAFWLLWIAFGALTASLWLAGWRTPYDPWAQWTFIAGKSLASACWLIIAISQLATISRYRRQGITWERLPLTVWGLVITDAFLVVVVPMQLLADGMQVLDTLTGTTFMAYEGTVPVAAVQNGIQAGTDWICPVSLWANVPVLFLLLLPAVGWFYDQLHPGQADRRPDPSVLNSMFGIAALALASSGHAFFRLVVESPFSAGPLLLPARLIVLPLAMIVGRLVLERQPAVNDDRLARTCAVAFVLTLLTGGLFSVLLSVDPVGGYLRATCSADALQAVLLLFGAILTALGVVYHRPGTRSSNRLARCAGWLQSATLCMGLPAIAWTWFLLGAAGLPTAVADVQPFRTLAVDPSWQVLLTALLTLVLGIQVALSCSWMVAWSLSRVFVGKRSG